MTQHNLNLSLNQQGRDVTFLQSRLINMGYTIATPEILGEVFGQSTVNQTGPSVKEQPAFLMP